MAVPLNRVPSPETLRSEDHLVFSAVTKYADRFRGLHITSFASSGTGGIPPPHFNDQQVNSILVASIGGYWGCGRARRGEAAKSTTTGALVLTAETGDSTEPQTRPLAGLSLRQSQIALLLVGLMFLLVQLVIVRHPLGLSQDESNYLAKVDPRVPELYWSQPRAWGMPVLAAPVAVFSPSLTIYRLYFGFLSSAGLVAAFWPWVRVLRPTVAPAAALFFSTIWFTATFGSLVMPNLYVGLGAVAVTGLFLRAVDDPVWWRLALTAAAAGFVALVRPTDSVLVIAPLFAIALVVARLRRLRVLAAVAIGELMGWLPWVIEGYLRFGGPVERLRAAETSGTHELNLRFSNLLIFPRLLDGTPTYCCSGGTPAAAGPVPLALTTWLVAVLLIAALGVAWSVSKRRLPEMMLVCLPAGLLAAFYLLLPGFTTLRFLLPAFALLSLPVAFALVQALTRWRQTAAVLIVAALVGHVASMLFLAERQMDASWRRRTAQIQAAAALQPLVHQRPCLVIANPPSPLAFYLGCAAQVSGNSKRQPRRVTQARAEGVFVLALLSAPPPPGSYMATWQQLPVPELARRFQVYIPPA